MRTFAAVLFIAFGLASTPAGAATEQVLARATAVQPPAWLERGGQKEALAAGTVLRSHDRIVTGRDGRVHLELAEDSIVKLGEDAVFEIPQIAMEEQGGLFRSSLEVLKGAFRFTTRALGKHTRRDVTVQIGVATAGVRGTDLWGKSDSRQDLICLLEGRIAIGTDGNLSQQMDEAGTYFVVPKGGAPMPVRPAPKDRLPGWASQTELAEDQATLYADGQYQVLVGSFDALDEARSEVLRLSRKGFASEIVTHKTQRYLVVVRGLGSVGEARRFAAHLRRMVDANRASFVPNF